MKWRFVFCLVLIIFLNYEILVCILKKDTEKPTTSKEQQTIMPREIRIFFLGIMSPNGVIINNPTAYPICFTFH